MSLPWVKKGTSSVHRALVRSTREVGIVNQHKTELSGEVGDDFILVRGSKETLFDRFVRDAIERRCVTLRFRKKDARLSVQQSGS